MNDEPKNTTISGNKLKDATSTQRIIHPNNVKKNKATSNGEISNLSVSDKHDDSTKTLDEQEFAHTNSNSGSNNGNLITDQNKDGGTKEAGYKRNSNRTPRRNHFTRSRNPRSSTPDKTKVEQQPKLVSFDRLCIAIAAIYAPVNTIPYSGQPCYGANDII